MADIESIAWFGGSLLWLAAKMEVPQPQPELSAIYDRLDALGNSLGILDNRLTGMAARALGSVPEPGQNTGTMRAVPDGAIGRMNDVIDGLVASAERIRDATNRLERLV